MCVYVDIYVYIYIYLHTNVCGKHISFTRHDTRLGKRFASKKAVWYSTILQGKCEFFHVPNTKGPQLVDGAHWKSSSSLPESNWVFGIYKTKGVYRFSLDLLLPNPPAPQATRILRPFFFGGRKDAIYIAGAEGLSKKQVFQVPSSGIVEARNESQKWVYPPNVFHMFHLRMAPKGIGDSGDSFCKPSFLGSKLNLGSAFASQKSRA